MMQKTVCPPAVRKQPASLVPSEVPTSHQKHLLLPMLLKFSAKSEVCTHCRTRFLDIDCVLSVQALPML